MSLTAKEEVVIELFRLLDIEQRNHLVRGMRALVDANRVTQRKLKGPIKVVGNGRIEARYGLPGPNGKKGSKLSDTDKPKPRRPDRGQDDAEGVE